MGQNFLVDGNLARKLVALSGIGESDRVFEVGPGMGMISRKFADGCKADCPGKGSTVIELLEGAIRGGVREPFSSYRRGCGGDAARSSANIEELHVIANPPFAITGPWIAGILDLGLPKTMALLLQKEAVERLTARAESKQFGVLSIRLHAAYEVRATHPVPNRCFYPEPRVMSQNSSPAAAG